MHIQFTALSRRVSAPEGTGRPTRRGRIARPLLAAFVIAGAALLVRPWPAAHAITYFTTEWDTTWYAPDGEFYQDYVKGWYKLQPIAAGPGYVTSCSLNPCANVYQLPSSFSLASVSDGYYIQGSTITFYANFK